MFERISVLAIAGALALGGCATKDSWMGAEKEKAYDKELEIKRLAEASNNDDYYEFEKDGRIYALSDAKDYVGFRTHGEIPYSTKKIGGGPGGKTVIFSLTKNETKLLEKDPKAQGAAQKMFEGRLKGMEKNFFGLVEKTDAYYVFGSWTDLESFKTGGRASGYSETAPDGRKAIYVGASSKNADVGERFAKLFPAR